MDATERCPACGAQLIPDVDWCGQCYARISRSDGEVKIAPPAPEPAEDSEAVARPAPPAVAQSELPSAGLLGSESSSPATAYEFLEQLAQAGGGTSVSTLPRPAHLGELPVGGPSEDPPAAEDGMALALAGSAAPMVSFGPKARKVATGIIVGGLLGSDFLFFPYVKLMVIYGTFAVMLAAFVLKKIWAPRSGKSEVE